MGKKVKTLLFLIMNVIYSYAVTEISFNSSAEVTKLILDDMNVLSSSKVSGFKLYYDDGNTSKTISIDKLIKKGDTVIVYNSKGEEHFTFLVQSYKHHVAIHLIDTAGLGSNPQYYHLQLMIYSGISNSISAYTINDLMTRTESSTYVSLDWPYLWARPRGDGSRGSVVLYNKTLSDSLMDIALAEIWATQASQGHMVKPNVDSWTESDIMKWIDWYVESFKDLSVGFKDLSVVSVYATTTEELYELVNKYVIPLEPKRVFMFQRGWCESGTYWVPKKRIFPNGEEDLKAFSDYLSSNGIMLHLKNMTPQVLPTLDGGYITEDSVDDRLMAWSSGVLANNISASATYIEFNGSVNIGYEDWATNSRWDVEYFRIGNEIVKVDSVAYVGNGVWKLYGCSRGEKGTKAVSHSAGEKMLGLVSKWGNLNYQEDFDLPNSLGEEIVGKYAEFMCRMHSTHIHFDGTGLNSPPWYTREYTDYAYSKFDYPTTGSTVGGGGLKAHFEKNFSKVKKIAGMLNYFPVRIGLRLHQTGRKHTELASSMLDINFDIMDGIALGSRRLFLTAGESGDMLSKKILENHGLTQYAFQLFKYWKEILPVLTDEDAQYIANSLSGKVKNHYKGNIVLVLSKNSEGKYIFTPHTVLSRTTGEDFMFVDQEWTGISPWQSVSTGGELRLYNPNKEQTLQFYIKNENDAQKYINPYISLSNGGYIAIKGELGQDEYMHYCGGDTVAVYDSNWVYQRTLKATVHNFIAPHDTFTVKLEAGSGSADIMTLFVTLGEPYVLKTNEVLAADTSAYLNPAVPVKGFSTTPKNIVVMLGELKSVTLIKPIFKPSNATDQRVVWISSDTTVARVTEGGHVIPVGVGTAVITGITKDGGFRSETYVTVLAPPENLALKGKATQSSDYSSTKGGAELAIDGNSDGVFNHGSTTHTQTEDKPWWQVDLGADYPIGVINIYGRTDDCCASRLSDYTVYVINSAGDTTFSQRFTTYPYVTTNALGTIGRIVRVQLNTYNALSLAEVEVYNYVDSSTSVGERNSILDDNKIKIYPNPFNEYLIILSKDKGREYRIYDKNGSVVQRGEIEGREVRVNTSKLPMGIYIIEIGKEKVRVYKTLSKECDCR